ncbi:MAG: tRNA guanosine(34) transglycosylase Tgt, partial [Alphaproteobacteria bacterium]|nr:tRNA guanosine(34) transglycosylase Tgt [Alphaproteobacteria bacterium]
ARRGRVHTAHGTVETPAFMATATAATVKAMHWRDVKAVGAELVIANTYHLMLRPGAEVVAKLGGLHQFTGWQGPILTDSGGYQVMSLSQLRKIDEKGVTFRSHLDGSAHELTPERAAHIQYQLDSNICMVLDECTPYPATEDQADQSMQLSMRWAERGRKAFVPRPGYGQFGIVQGGIYPRLRHQSAAALIRIGFEGYGIGGLAVGEPQAEMFGILADITPALPQNQPRYLMGVGKPDDLVGAVARGVDMFDCVMPTRSGRTAQAFTPRGTVNMRNARHQHDPRPLQDDCACPACGHSRAYLHHLFRQEEMLGPMLLTWHNVHYYQTLMTQMRHAIETQTWADFATHFDETQKLGDIPLHA